MYLGQTSVKGNPEKFCYVCKREREFRISKGFKIYTCGHRVRAKQRGKNAR